MFDAGCRGNCGSPKTIRRWSRYRRRSGRASSTARMASATARARSSGVARAVASKWRSTAGTAAGSGPAMGGRSGSVSVSRVIAMACSTTAAYGIGVEPVGGRARGASIDCRANREVRAALGDILMDSVVGEAGERLILGIEDRFDIGHARGARGGAPPARRSRRSVQPAYAPPILILRNRDGLAPWPVPITCSGWPLPQLGTPQRVQCSGPADGRAGVPELGGDAAVAGVLEHADALAVAHLPGDLAAELEVVALVVDGPAPVGLHVDGVVATEDLIERLVAGQQADVGHADQRKPRPSRRRACSRWNGAGRPPRRSRARSCSR